MLEKKYQITDLFGKYFRKELSPEEAAALEAWLAEDKAHRQLLEQISNDDTMEAGMKRYDRSVRPGLWEKLESQLDEEKVVSSKPASIVSVKKWVYIALAAAVLIIIANWLIKVNKDPGNPPEETKVVETKTNPVDTSSTQPGNKAFLETATGRKIPLHEKTKGLIESQGAFKVTRYENGIRYDSNGMAAINEDLTNTITTPNAGKFEVMLPDGTTITLNVASSLSFKVSHGGAIRQVTVTGEAEFDITSNPGHPFIVMISSPNKRGRDGSRAEVFGTRFNVNAYDEADVSKVTLLEGGLKVYAPGSSQPVGLDVGQEAQINNKGVIKVEDSIDTEDAVAWKTGKVKFNHKPVREVLSMIEKWYDVTLESSAKKIPKCSFSGGITPTMPINEIITNVEKQCPGLSLKYVRAQNRP